MMIRFKNGSTWQVVGSDNFNSLVGSPPAGIVFSEWSIANPAAWGYMRPILAENGGWALFIYTPRGKNHGYKTWQVSMKEPEWFGQVLPVSETKALPDAMVKNELREYISEYGDEQGKAFFEQEYECSFDAALLGAVYGHCMTKVDKEKRAGDHVEIANGTQVHTAWDLGYGDATVIVFFQILHGEIRVIDCYEASGVDVKHYCDVLKKKAYSYGNHYVPHDAANKLLAAGGRSIVQLAYQQGVHMKIVHATSMENSISALRLTLERCWFRLPECGRLMEALKQYQYEWDAGRQMFKHTPKHDWTSHFCDAMEIMARVWQVPKAENPPPKPIFLENMLAKDVFQLDSVEYEGYSRI
jgi:hypothetical protein